MSRNNNKVLIISFYFPPTNTIGAVRIGKFAKYLAEFGWDPVILTANNVRGIPETLPLEFNHHSITRTPYHTFYERLTCKNLRTQVISSQEQIQHNRQSCFKEIIKDVIRSTRSIYNIPVINRMLFEPMGWKESAVKAGLELIKSEHIDVIFSSFGPTVDHIIGERLHKLTNIPWVAEFRDPWTITQPNPFYYVDKRWEKQTLKQASLLVTVTPTLVQELENFHSKPTELITNGFDESDYEGNFTPSDKLRITYTGTIYPGKRDPTPIFKAIGELKNEGLVSTDSLEMCFYGDNVSEYIPEFAKQCGVSDFIKLGGNIAFKESVKKQMESAALLILEWNNPKGRGNYTGKMFEYFGARKPILALGFKNGDIDKLLQDSGCGVMANDVSEIKIILLRWIEEYKNKKITYCYQPMNEIVAKYTRREQTKKLASLFEHVLVKNN